MASSSVHLAALFWPITPPDRRSDKRRAAPGNDWIDVKLDGPGIENTEERRWRFAPHGWAVMRANLNAELHDLNPGTGKAPLRP
jgi:hypothetical protein